MSQSAMVRNKVNIKVIGVGGGGCNAVDHMSDETIEGVSFYGLNTDLQALKEKNIEHKIQLGDTSSRGLGAGADPEVGRLAAEESIDQIKDILNDTDMAFITAGMGGGTGTGAAPVVARISKEMGVLTVGVVTKPFNFENRTYVAENGIDELSKYCDCILVIPNNNLININSKVTLLDMFREVDDILLKSVKGIAEIITKPSLINVDYADVKKVMSFKGNAMLGMGSASGENKIYEATKKAIETPLLETKTIKGARGILINIVSDVNFSIPDLENIGALIRNDIDDKATVIMGVSIDNEFEDTVTVTVVATDINEDENLEQEKDEHRFRRLSQKKIQTSSFKKMKDEEKNSSKSDNNNSDILSQTTKKESNDDDVINIPAFLRK